MISIVSINSSTPANLIKSSVGDESSIELIEVLNENNIVETVNNAIAKSSGDSILIIDDYFNISQNWDIPVREVFKVYEDIGVICFSDRKSIANPDEVDVENTEISIWQAGEPVVLRKSFIERMRYLDTKFTNLQISYEDLFIRGALSKASFGTIDTAFVERLSSIPSTANGSFNESLNTLKRKWGIVTNGPFLIDYQSTRIKGMLEVIKLGSNPHIDLSKDLVDENGNTIALLRKDMPGAQKTDTVISLRDDQSFTEIGPL